MKFWAFFALIFTALQTMFSAKIVKAQITNELAFETAVLRLIGQKSPSIDSLTGFVTDRLRSEILLTAPSKRQLTVETPDVDYVRVRHGRYERTIASLLTFTDSTEVSYPVIYRDTIQRSTLKAVRKTDYTDLRGTDPRWHTKYLMPVVLIGTGIAVIVSLFYLRS